MTTLEDIAALRRNELNLRRDAERLRRLVYSGPDPAQFAVLLAELGEAESALSAAETARTAAESVRDDRSSAVIDTEVRSKLLGPDTTGLEAKVQLRMAQVPTSIYHLLDEEANPLLTCSVRNATDAVKRVRITSFIEGYSAHAVDTVELEGRATFKFKQLPTLYPERVRTLDELARATLNVLVEELGGSVELQQTKPVWLLARTTAPLAIADPVTGLWQDLTPYLGAFVTPNDRACMLFLGHAVSRHPEKRFVGYQGNASDTSIVLQQVRALFEALKADAGIQYVNSVIGFSPLDGASINQRIRLPAESLEEKQANCVDGTVLFASLLEAVSLSPALVVVPGHAFVAWESWEGSRKWAYLETTMIGSHSFDEACDSAERLANLYGQLSEKSNDVSRLRRWPLRELRATRHVFPMA